jgi:26S proteasome regulatory subunit N13
VLSVFVAEDEEDEPEDSSQAVSETSEGAVPDKLEAPLYVNNTDLNEGATASSDDIPHGSSSGVVQLADLQRILSGLGQTPGDIGIARDRGPGFSELLKPDIVVPLLENLQLEERLAPYLPEGVQSKQAIAELMQSPQFHQQLDSFTQVLRSGQMDLSQFGIDPSKYNFTVASFLEAIEEQAGADGSENEKEQRPNQDVMKEGR